ncbi:MAG: DNA polymerase III subunit epsilon [Burkholderiaceae bacterium]|nr:DNA polymerase III subunit epsilon [Burkholderiaceae bacterium]MCD8516961.1 DNA polymerase III subunit epsilon [Burkholderiaceae bacterium]MCD8565669.1 DNA polymerase III subunit epsilon [Burkholderiaceae bacterium]
MRWVILDTETTGLDPEDGHRIIEIGAVEVVNRGITGRDFHTYLNPDRDSDAGALEVHGLTTEFLQDKPRFKDVVGEFLEFVKEAELIIHNAPFDLKFLNAELKKLGHEEITMYTGPVTDSLAHAKSLYPGKRNSLDALCERYGISNAHRTLHGALLDSRLLAEVWLAMTRGQDSLAIEDEVHPSKNLAPEKRKFYDLPLIEVSDAELEAHEQYLQVLDKASGDQTLWRSLVN